MKREELIKKWLDHSLSPEEQKDFEQLEEYKELKKLSEQTKNFKAADFNIEEEYKNLTSRLKPKINTNWITPFLRIAAVLVVGFSIFYYTLNLDKIIATEIAEQTKIELPDNSIVNLNAVSKLTYNKNSWSDNREVRLDGEAFFKVAKGSRFDVITDMGKVSVLGTEFNVIQRTNYFEVTCYEGLVAVSYESDDLKLSPGDMFTVINGVISKHKNVKIEPSWLTAESDFKSKPLKFVLKEMERHYDISFKTDAVNTSQLFSGTFTHKNLDLALKSVTLPLGLSYTIKDNVIVLKSE